MNEIPSGVKLYNYDEVGKLSKDNIPERWLVDNEGPLGWRAFDADAKNCVSTQWTRVPLTLRTSCGDSRKRRGMIKSHRKSLMNSFLNRKTETSFMRTI